MKENIKVRMFLTAIVAIVVSTLVAHTKLPAVAIPAGFISGLCTSFGYLKYKDLKTTVFDSIAALVGSQMGWVSLLI